MPSLGYGKFVFPFSCLQVVELSFVLEKDYSTDGLLFLADLLFYLVIHRIFQRVDKKALRSRWNFAFNSSRFTFLNCLFLFFIFYFFRTPPVKMIGVRVDLTKVKTMKIIVVYVEMVGNCYVVIRVPKCITYIATYRLWQIYQGRPSLILNLMCHFVICIFGADYVIVL